MIITYGVEDIKKRTSQDEFFYLVQKYPNVAFNYKWLPNYHTPENGYRHLFCGEPYIEVPENWNIDIIKRYKTYITFNRKMAMKCQGITDVKIINGPLSCNNYYALDKFLGYNEKQRGIVMINKLHNTNMEGDIYYLREKIMMEMKVSPFLVKHIYARHPWGGKMYQGNIPFVYSHYENLKKINEYLFCICFESTYHPFWSWDFVTERLFNCFKSKTIAIYFGCYNIEEFVPKDLFIDYRDFDFDNNKLSDYLLSFPKHKYIEMANNAYEWNKSNKIGDVHTLEKILMELR